MKSSHQNPPSVAVIGGGISGLSAAWQIQRQAPHLQLTIIESEPRLGGKVVTARLAVDGAGDAIIDGGPESFITRKREAWDLAIQLGLRSKLVNPGSETSRIFVLYNGQPYRIPLDPLNFITSSLLTTRGKLRMLSEPFQPARRDLEDESLASFIDRRLGREARERFIGPVLGGIYNTDPERQSILTTSPVMREMEAEHGGLFLGALGRMRRKRPLDAEGQRPPSFASFASGTQELVDALQDQLKANLILGDGAISIQSSPAGYTIATARGRVIHASALVLAVTANVAARLLAQTAPQAAAGMQAIRHENIGTISLLYRKEDVSIPLPLNGLMIPRRERRAIDAITWTSNKSPERAPHGYHLLRVFFGGSRPDLVTASDDQLLATVQAELDSLLGVRGKVSGYRAFRWEQGFPQADVGHLQHVDAIEAGLPPGIAIANSSYRGIGVPDCVRQGNQAAGRILAYLQQSVPNEVVPQV